MNQYRPNNLLFLGQLFVLSFNCCTSAMLPQEFDQENESSLHYEGQEEGRRSRRCCCCGKTCFFCVGLIAGAAIFGSFVWLTNWGTGQVCDKAEQGCGALYSSLVNCREQVEGLRGEVECYADLVPWAKKNCTEGRK